MKEIRMAENDVRIRKNYRKPQLQKWGMVNVHTQGGTPGAKDDEIVLYTYSLPI